MANVYKKNCVIRAVRQVNNRRKRTIIFKKQINPFVTLNEVEFKRRYRFNKETIRFILNLIQDQLVPLQERINILSPELQLFIALRYFAKEMFQEDNGDLHGISQPSVSKIVKKVSIALASKVNNFIKFDNDLRNTKQQFYSVANFPLVIGAVDCTHIKIKNPDKERPLLYCNRKGWHSLNVQVVCDAKYRIVDLVARWRGSAHDFGIWDYCNLKQKLENGQMQGIILADSGYACCQYLLTPLLNPTTQAENRYNAAHIRTRTIIECCFGQWKACFRVLQNGILISLDTAKAAIIAMAVLHNIRINMQQNEEAFDLEDTGDEMSIDDNIEMQQNIVQLQPPTVRGNVFSAHFIRRHFS